MILGRAGGRGFCLAMSHQVRTKTRTETDPPAFNLRRLRAALDIRGGSVEAIARDAKLSSRHVWFCINRERRPTDRLLGIIRAALGEPGWAFATGQTDTLRDEGVSHAA